MCGQNSRRKRSFPNREKRWEKKGKKAGRRRARRQGETPRVWTCVRRSAYTWCACVAFQSPAGDLGMVWNGKKDLEEPGRVRSGRKPKKTHEAGSLQVPSGDVQWPRRVVQPIFHA